jgi:UDP-GlcNAc:undecaprenyl-phosphate GlcNAc-1-phosphate transferase
MWMWAALVAGGSVLVSLLGGRTTWIGLGAAFAFVEVTTFVLPIVHKPGSRKPETL